MGEPEAAELASSDPDAPGRPGDARPEDEPPQDQRDELPIAGAAVALGVVAAIWALTFFRLAALRHDRFGTFGFDLGIHDQAAWLMSQGLTPFITIRGLDAFGHHFTPIYWLFAPAYWLGAGPHFLLALQVAGQVLAAAALYLLVQDLLGRAWAWFGTAVGTLFLLHPTSGWLVWEFFHPEVMGLGPLLMAYRAARTQRWRAFVVWSVVACACKEDFFLAIAVIALVHVVPKRRAFGFGAVGAALASYLVYTRLIVLWRTGTAHPFYDDFYQPYADSQFGVVFHFLAHPGQAWKVLTDGDRLAYYRAIFIPVAIVVPFIGWRGFAFGVPALVGNVLTGPVYPYTHVYKYHYSAIVVAALFAGVVEAAVVLRRWTAGRSPTLVRSVTAVFVAVMLACGLYGYRHWGVGPESVSFRSGAWPIAPSESMLDVALGRIHIDDYADVANVRSALRHVPGGVPTTAEYDMTPHLTHRARIYEWPNPFIPVNWANHGERQQSPVGLETIVLRPKIVFGSSSVQTNDQRTDEELFNALTQHEFDVVYDDGDVVVAHRVAPPGCLTISHELAARLGSFYVAAPQGNEPSSQTRVCPSH
jgi:uncharacterized membrane protein